MVVVAVVVVNQLVQAVQLVDLAVAVLVETHQVALQ